MNQQIKEQRKGRIKKALGMLALAAVTAFGSVRARAEEPKEEAGYEPRAKVEYSGDADQRDRVQTTLGLAEKGVYEKGPIPSYGQYFELFRLYNIAEKKNGVWSNFTPLGAKVTLPKLAELESKIMAFGSTGDIQGAGLESNHKLGDLSFVFNGEYNAKDELTPKNEGASRVGGELNYTIDKFTLGAAFDTVKNEKGRTNQSLGRVIYEINPVDSLIGTFAVKNETDDSNTYSGYLAFVHKSTENSLGLRFKGKVDSNPEQDYNNFAGEFLIASGLKGGKIGAVYSSGRRSGEDGWFNQSVIPLSVSKSEALRLHDRSLEGFSGRINVCHTEKEGNSTGMYGAGVGYTSPPAILGGKLGISTEAYYNSDSNGNYFSIVPGLTFRKGDLEIELGADIPLDDNQDPCFRAGVQYVF